MRITSSAIRSASCSYWSPGWPIVSLGWIVPVQRGQAPSQGQMGFRWMSLLAVEETAADTLVTRFCCLHDPLFIKELLINVLGVKTFIFILRPWLI